MHEFSKQLERSEAMRVMVATDGSETADNAVQWAASFADRFKAELFLIQVVVPRDPPSTERGAAERTRADAALADLTDYAYRLADARGNARVIIDHDPAAAIVNAAEEAAVDVLVVGNLGMSGRKEFLLRNVPNRISHNARCTVVIVNSKQSGENTVPPQGATRDQTVNEPRLFARGAQIASIMAKHGIQQFLDRTTEDGDAGRRRQAQRLRAALEELGPTFSKLGQILSTRPDLLPAEYIEELARLQDHVPPLMEREVVTVMEQELGVPWEDVFASIDPSPLAAGTIGQVHRATLVSGDRVVVKVQRPHARDQIEQDLALLKAFAEQVNQRPRLNKVIDVEAVFKQLSQSLHRELDFLQEAANIDRMSEIIVGYERLAVPAVHSSLSTSRLLVMQEIQGGPILQAPEGSIRKEAARQLLESFYKQIVSAGFFHADPHPGNLMWWNDKIYFLDFGMVGSLDAELRKQLMWLLMAFWREDAKFLTDVTLMLSSAPDAAQLDVGALQEEIGALMNKYRRAGLADMQVGPILQEMSEVALRHGVPLPASLTLLGKALAQVQLATAQLDPELDPFEVAGKFLTRSILKDATSRLDPKAILFETQKLKVRATRLFATLERVLGARTGKNFEVSFRAHVLEDTVSRAGRRLAVGLIAAAGIIAAGMTATSANAASWVPTTFGTIAGVLTLGLIFDVAKQR